MKMKEYAVLLVELAAKYPNAEAIFSIDEEGNGYGPVVFGPTAGNFDGEEFDSVNEEGKMDGDGKINAVCIN